MCGSPTTVLLAAAGREAVPDALTVLRNAKIDPRQLGPSGPDLLAMAARGDAGVQPAAEKFIALKDGDVSKADITAQHEAQVKENAVERLRGIVP